VPPPETRYARLQGDRNRLPGPWRSAFVPTDTMPGPVRAFAENQPVTSVVNAIRWIAPAWCAGILVVADSFARVGYRRRISCPGSGWP